MWQQENAYTTVINQCMCSNFQTNLKEEKRNKHAHILKIVMKACELREKHQINIRVNRVRMYVYLKLAKNIYSVCAITFRRNLLVFPW